MDNRSEKAVVGNAVRFAKAIPNLVRINTNALSSPQIITTPKSVNITKTALFGRRDCSKHVRKAQYQVFLFVISLTNARTI